MEINLEEILIKNTDSFQENTRLKSDVLEAMKEVWNLAVDTCIENVEATYDSAYNVTIDLNSLNQVKKMI